MATVAPTDRFTRRDIKRAKQRGGAVAVIIVAVAVEAGAAQYAVGFGGEEGALNRRGRDRARKGRAVRRAG